MPPRLPIPKELLEDNPDLTIYEIRDILNVILKAKNNRMRQAHIFKVVLPGIGVIRSRGNKRPKRRQKVLKKDRERKRKKKKKDVPPNYTGSMFNPCNKDKPENNSGWTEEGTRKHFQD